MKTLTALVILTLALLVIGCAPRYQTVARHGVPVAPSGIPGEAGVVSQDVAGVNALEQELGLEELEGLDQDLDLGL